MLMRDSQQHVPVALRISMGTFNSMPRKSLAAPSLGSAHAWRKPSVAAEGGIATDGRGRTCSFLSPANLALRPRASSLSLHQAN